MRVLVTGGSGYLGTALLPLLKGYELRILDINPPATHLDDVEYTFFHGSLTDAERVKEAAEDAEAVIHLAGIAGVDICERNQELSEKVNVKGTDAILKEAKSAEKFLFVSSSAVYGLMEGNIDEETQTNPINTYGKHKLKAEELVKNSGTDYIILRPSNLYGASSLIPEKYAIHKMIGDALRTETITVSYGNLMRNFIHVRDCAKAISMLMKSEIKNKTYNIGDFDIKLFEIANKIAEEISLLYGKRVRVYVKNRDEKQPLHYSWQKLRDFGFSPEISPEKGIRELIDALEHSIY